jgi:hypothetical protein
VADQVASLIDVRQRDSASNTKKRGQHANSRTSISIAENIQRKAYLHAKGINPEIQFQLSFLFEKTACDRDDLRHLPNDWGRSSLYTVRNKREKRKLLTREKLFHLNEEISILYTGIELRADDDELIWLQILQYGINVPFGEEFDFSIKDLVRDVNWSKNGRYYDKARECISRLKGNEVLALNTKAYGTSGSFSLIQDYTSTNDIDGKPCKYRVRLDPKLIVLFAGNTFTSHVWESYRELSPVARRLADYAVSHKYPYRLALKKFQMMCGSINRNISSWRQTVNKACCEIELRGIAKQAFLKDDYLHFVREHKSKM